MSALGASIAVLIWLLSGWRAEDVQDIGMHARQIASAVMMPVYRFGNRLMGHLPRLRKSGSADAPTLGEISEMVDVVRLGLSAGLSFDAAVDVYCTNRASRLGEELARAKTMWQTGVCSREEALMQAADTLGVRALETFATTVGQGLALGAPLSETLAAQSSEIRSAHRAEVEREIERAPVKLLIPTGTLILPALLLSILGPLLAAGEML